MEYALKIYIDSQKRWITKVLAFLQVKFASQYICGNDCIDIGCGCGVLEAEYGCNANRFESCDIKDYNLYGIDVEICPAEHLHYPDNAFDVVFMLGVIEHTDDSQEAIDECHRVLYKGGQLILTIPNGFVWKMMGWFKRFLPDRWAQHAAFNEKKLMRLTKQWSLIKHKIIIPGLFHAYEFEPVDNGVLL